ncbi:hypothetical protein PMZ80_006783 [Knufia obscura]|uniref:Uncharacterized protein n=1 Tax=Knufia obscura TaxID=1635080 RepID=A0ABR0RLK9_9EURO|nr:hypothetical protein PMZ80_006783 [Knufia obscura]
MATTINDLPPELRVMILKDVLQHLADNYDKPKHIRHVVKRLLFELLKISKTWCNTILDIIWKDANTRGRAHWRSFVKGKVRAARLGKWLKENNSKNFEKQR